MTTDPRTGDTTIGGISEVHLEAIVHRLAREFLVESAVGPLRIAYKEGITRPADGETKYCSQAGGHGQYAHVKLHLRPGADGSGYAFENAICGGAIPARFVPAIDAGIRDALSRGVLDGYPMDDVSVELYDGSYHDVDSSEAAFRIAGALALLDAARKAGAVPLEPVMRMQVIVPVHHAGRVVHDLLARGAQIGAQAERDALVTIAARAPLAAMLGYASWLAQLTTGRGVCDVRFERYDRVEGGGRADADFQATPVIPSGPPPTLGPLKAESQEPDD